MESSKMSEEQQWMDLLKDFREETIALLKCGLKPLKEEARQKKTQIVQKHRELQGRRSLEVKAASATLESRLSEEMNALEAFERATCSYAEQAYGRLPAKEPERQFLSFLEAHPEYDRFHNSLLRTISAQRLKKSALPRQLIRKAAEEDIFVIYRSDIPYIKNQMLGFISQNRRTLEQQHAHEVAAKREDVRKSCSGQTIALRQQYAEAVKTYKAAKKKRMEESARSLVDALVHVSEEITNLRNKHDPFKVKVYHALSDLDEYKKSEPSVVFNASEDDKLCSMLGELVYEKKITEQYAIKIRDILRANYIQQEPSVELTGTAQQPTARDDAPRRLEVLVQIVGEETIARRILAANPELASVGVNHFETYTGALKETKRNLHAAGKALRMGLHPEQFASLDALRQVNATVGQEDEIDRIYHVLEGRGYDPYVVDAIISAFKPQTRGFLGGSNPISKKSVWNNVRPIIPDKLGLVDEYLHLLVSEGVVERKGKSKEGPYNLNSHVNERTIPDETLRSLVRYRMPKNGG